MKRLEDQIKHDRRRINRRSLLVGGAQLGFAGLLGWRMRYLQIEQADQYQLMAEENRINVRLLPPQRGEIYDRNGLIVAQNEPSYRITLVKELAGDVDEVLEKLVQLVPISDATLARARNELARSAPFLPVTIIDRVSWSDISKVAVNAPALPGVTPDVGMSRSYPFGENFAHVVGYVGPVSTRDLERRDDPDPLLRIPRFQIGKVGIESKYENQLRGRAGARRVEVNAVGRIMRELDRQEGQTGSTLQISTDTALQSYVQARLGQNSASAVVIDCTTGDILAIASSPGYDPNKFVRGISLKDYAELRDNERRPLASKSVQDAYPPGSTFKMITALAALEAGVISPNDTVKCRGHLEVSDRKFHCWKAGGHGNMNLEKSLRESCDVYYYELALKVGIEKISQMAKTFGIGVRHAVPLSAESKGLAPDKKWKLLNRGREWVIGDTVNASIGQGFVLCSPLQLAVMSARLATGKNIKPQLIKRVGADPISVTEAEPLPVSENNLRFIRRAMFEVSNNRRGTAFASRIATEEFRMAGKTGTSQVRNISEKERARGVTANEDLEWKRRDHALFLNFAPYDDPKIAVAVVVEHGGGGSKAAAPIARDITLQALYEGDPPLDAYPEEDRAKIARQQRELRKMQPDLSTARKGRA
ncbi:MAG: penicillin-binding protein 2 [Paracoccaceae bacterium]